MPYCSPNSKFTRKNLLLNLGKLLSLLILSSFLITACNNDNNISGVSLKTPQNLFATSGARAVVLNWSGVSNAKRYTLYWSNNPNVSRGNSAAIQITTTQYQHIDLNNGSDYYYAVSSHTGSGESVLSNEVRGQPQLATPAKPTLLRLKAEDRRITIDFDRIDGVTEYHLLWATDATLLADGATQANRINDVTEPFVHDNLSNGQNYYYILRVINSVSKSTDSDIFQATPALARPFAPLITNATTESEAITLTWANSSNAEFFDLYWSNSPNVTTSDAYVLQVQSPYKHAPLVAGKDYYYRVLARNRAGSSPLSNEAQISVANGTVIVSAGNPPLPPTSVTKQIADSQITLDWNAAEGPSSLAFNLYWQRGNTVLDNSTVLDQQNNSGIIRNIQPPYTHVGLQNGTYYYYRISALNQAGESILTSRSALITARPEAIIPGVPSGVSVVASDQRLTVRWIPVSLADTYTLSIRAQNANITITPNVTSPYTIGNLLNRQAYVITLQSVRGNIVSPASVEVQASPQAPRPNAPTQVVAIPRDGLIELQWLSATTQAAAVASEVAVTAYQIYQGNNANITPANATLLTTLTPQIMNTDGWQVNVSGLINNARYYYIITALNSAGEGPPSPIVWALPKASVPSAPSQVYAKAGDNEVRVYFTPAADTSTSYNIYWSKDINDVRSATQVITNIIPTPAYVFTDGQSNGTTYYFKISAISTGGESVFSEEVSATPQIPTPQSAPANLTVSSISEQVTLDWGRVAMANRYAVYWSTGVNVDPTTSAVLYVDKALTTLTHTGLQNGQRYYYRVAAQNSGGMGPASSLVSALPQIALPTTPNTFATVAGDAKVTLNWAKTIAATGYVLHWRYLADTQWSLIPGVESGYVHNNLINNQIYEYQLSARNIAGESPTTAIRQATPLQAATAKPDGLSVAAGDQQNSISWNRKAGVTYRIHWSSGVADPLTSGNIINLASPVTVHGSSTPLNNGQVYNYQIIASYKGVDSVATDVISATPNAIIAGSPSGLSAQAGDSQNTVAWFAPSDANSVTVYTLYWGTQAGSLPNTAINTVSSPYVHSGLSNNQTYYYRVSSGIGLFSNIATATPQPTLPKTPKAVTVSSSSASSNTLSWQSVSEAASYSIESSITGAFDDVQTREVSAPSTTFQHNGLNPDVAVFYRVFAFNNTGRSQYSAIVRGTPKAGSQPGNVAPVAGQLKISAFSNGPLKVGSVLSGSFVYSDVDNDDSGRALLQWYRNTFPINNATSTFYTLTVDDVGQKISFEVIPVALTGISPGLAQRASIDFNIGNNAPALVNNQLTLTEGQTIILSSTNIDANDTDGNNQNLLYSVSGVSSGFFANNATPAMPISTFIQSQITSAQIVFVHDGGESAPTYSLIVSDGSLDSSGDVLTTATINFSNINDPPVFASGIRTTFQYEVGQPLTGATAITEISATDVDSSTLSFSANNLPDGLVINNNSGVISGTISNFSSVTYSSTIIVNDGDLNDSFSSQWTVLQASASASIATIIPTSGNITTGTLVTLNVRSKIDTATNRNFSGDSVVINVRGANFNNLTATYVSNGLYTSTYTADNVGRDTYTVQINNTLVGTGPVDKFIVPAAPSNFTLSATTNSIDLSWTQVSNMVYLVYRSESANVMANTPQVLTPSFFSANNFVDDTALFNTTYYYVVTATTGSSESDPSIELNHTLNLVTQNLLANAGNRLANIDSASGDISYISSGGVAGRDKISHLTLNTSNGKLYALDTIDQELVEVSKLTGKATTVISLKGTDIDRGLVYYPIDGFLYAVGRSGFFKIDIATRSINNIAAISNTAYASISNLAYNAGDGNFYSLARNNTDAIFYQIGPPPAFATVQYGTLSRTSRSDTLTYDPISDSMLIFDGSFLVSANLSDPANISGTRVGQLSAISINSMVYDDTNPIDINIYAIELSSRAKRIIEFKLPNRGGVKIKRIEPGLQVVTALVYNERGAYYGYDSNRDQFFSYTVAGKTINIIKEKFGQAINALALVPGATPAQDTVYAIVNNDTLVQLDPNTGTIIKTIGRLSLNVPISDMAYNRANSTLYGIYSGNLYTIDITDASMIDLNNTDLVSGRSLAYHSGDQLLYSLGGSEPNELSSYNPSTKVNTIVKTVNLISITNFSTELVLTVNNGQFITVNPFAGELVSFDNIINNPNTTLHAQLGFNIGNFSSYDDVNNRSYAINAPPWFATTGTDKLIAIDPATELASLIVDTGLLYISDLAHVTIANTLKIFAIRNTNASSGPNTGDVELYDLNITGQPQLLGKFPTENKISGIAFDDVGNLYAVDSNSGNFYNVNISNAALSLIGYTGFQFPTGLTYNKNSQRFYSADFSIINGTTVRIISIDPALGTASLLGEGYAASQAMVSYDSVNDQLMMASNGSIYSDYNSTPIFYSTTGVYGILSLTSLSFGRLQNSLYSVDQMTNRLLKINPSSGDFDYVSNNRVGFYNVVGLAYDELNNIIFGYDDYVHQLITIDTTTGIGAVAGPRQNRASFAGISGLALRPSDGQLFACDNGNIFTVSRTGVIAVVPGAVPQYTTFPNLDNIAFNNNDELFTIIQQNGHRKLMKINTTDPSLSIVYSKSGGQNNIGFSSRETGRLPAALAFNNITSALMGGYPSRTSARILNVDFSTGLGTSVGSLYENLTSMAFNPMGNALYGMRYDSGTTYLYQIDSTKGSLQSLGHFPSVDTNGGLITTDAIAFDETGKLYVSQTGPDAQLMEINLASLTASPLGAIGFGAISGLSFNSQDKKMYALDTNTAFTPSNQLLTVDLVSGTAVAVAGSNLLNTETDLSYSSANNFFFSMSVNVGGSLMTIDPSTATSKSIGIFDPTYFTPISALVSVP